MVRGQALLPVDTPRSGGAVWGRERRQLGGPGAGQWTGTPSLPLALDPDCSLLCPPEETLAEQGR